MDLKLNALMCGVHLVGIAVTLRRLYPPPTDLPDALRLALARVDIRTANDGSLKRRSS